MARKDIVNSLDQEHDGVWIHLPEIIPCDLSLHHLLPCGPGSLLSHCHCSDGLLLLHSCPLFTLDHFSLLFPLYFVKTGDFKASSPTLPLAAARTSTLWYSQASDSSTAASALHVPLILTATLAADPFHLKFLATAALLLFAKP